MSWLGPPARLCGCGSGLYSEPIYDARNIYCGRACEKCRKEHMAGFRPEVFTDPDYEADEPIEEDE
jgi:hypothetical protein